MQSFDGVEIDDDGLVHPFGFVRTINIKWGRPRVSYYSDRLLLFDDGNFRAAIVADRLVATNEQGEPVVTIELKDLIVLVAIESRTVGDDGVLLPSEHPPVFKVDTKYAGQDLVVICTEEIDDYRIIDPNDNKIINWEIVQS